MLRQLIVNADDYGYTPGTSRGILKAHQSGIVTSTSVMVNMPAAAEWVPKAIAETPALGLGLHITLTAGEPVSLPDDVPDLVAPGGGFYPRDTLIGLMPGLNITQVEREMLAQVARFEEIAGRLPDHLDSHHHITYLNPPIIKLMVKLAHELDIPIRNPLPGDPDDTEQVAAKIAELVSIAPDTAYLEEMVDIIRGYVSSAGVRMPDRLNVSFFGERATLGDLLLLLLDTPEGVTELMCHPAEIDDELRATSGYLEPREAELAALTHPSAREALNSEFIQLINFGDLK